MAAEPLLSFDELLPPISDDNPAGESVPYDLRQRLDEDRKEEDPDAFAPDDPMRPEKPKRADWPGIVRQCQEILQRTSKDLLVSARLTEALTKLHGFAGARDGLHLIGLLVDQCWDRLNPPIEDGDVELRLSPFIWLDETDRGARFPTTLRQLPLINGPEGKFSWLDWKAFQEGRPTIPREELEKAMRSTPLSFCQQQLEEITQSLHELDVLTQNLNAKMGPMAPGLTGIRQALDGCRLLTQSLVDSKGGEAPAEPKPSEEQTAAAAPQPGDGVARPAASRAEAYRQLQQAASLLEQLEPHSPVPYLVRKAVELGKLPFPELMRRLIRDANVLTELNRELGIKGEEAPPAEGSS
jgi:type VI secretion system protein ImpA